jgi:hypothetical protein
MPNYATLWRAAWTPFANSGKASSLDGVRAFVQKVEGLKFLENLTQLNRLYNALDSYRVACRNLHKNPTDEKLNNAERALFQAAKNEVPNFLPHARKVVEQETQIAKFFQEYREPLRAHDALLRPVVKELTTIKNGVPPDVDAFSTTGKTDSFLEKIRRNPG